MDARRANYVLRRIASSSDPAFAEALKIYAQAVPPTFRTDTNEIAHWIDRYEACFGDPLLIFGFWVGRRLVGFAHLVYFKSEEIVVADYLAIDPHYRKNNVFFEFADQIREYLVAQGWSVRWTVVEVAWSYKPRPDADATLLIRLLKLEGFRVAKASYYQPLLSFNNRESEMPAVLLMAGDPELKRVTRETYLEIVSTIYQKHYLRWYSIYPIEQQKDRAKRMRELEQCIRQELGRAKHIVLNGHDILLGAGIGVTRDTSTAERNLATNAVRVAIPILLALGGGVLPDPFRIALWSVLGAGVLLAVLVWPSARLRRFLWKEVRVFRKRE